MSTPRQPHETIIRALRVDPMAPARRFTKLRPADEEAPYGSPGDIDRVIVRRRQEQRRAERLALAEDVPSPDPDELRLRMLRLRAQHGRW